MLNACGNEQSARPESVTHLVTLQWTSTTKIAAERREFCALDVSDVGNVSGVRVEPGEWHAYQSERFREAGSDCGN